VFGDIRHTKALYVHAFGLQPLLLLHHTLAPWPGSERCGRGERRASERERERERESERERGDRERARERQRERTTEREGKD